MARRTKSGADSGAVLTWPGKHTPFPAPAPPRFEPWERFGAAQTALPPGRLFMGDNMDVLRRLLSEGGVSRPMLVYIDPPYAMQATHGVRVGDGTDAVAYSDSWSDAEYCQFMYERLTLMHALLHDEGAMFVHCDWRASAWLRVMLDEVFGRECFRNEIVWRRAPNLGRQASGKQLGRCVDSILVFSKAPGSPFRGPAPVRSTAVALTRKGTPRGARWDAGRNAWFTLAPRGDYTDESMRALAREGRVHTSPTGTQYVKYFLRTAQDGTVFKDAPLDTLWADPGVPPLRFAARRELGIRYVTQKPEALLERIIGWATRPGDLVADFFAGSGTTLAVAERLGRAWIGADSGPLAVHTVRKRMLGLGARFDVLTSGQALGAARAARAGDRIIVADVSWPDQATPAALLRVTRAKSGRAGRSRTVGSKRPATTESGVDLIVARTTPPHAPPTTPAAGQDVHSSVAGTTAEVLADARHSWELHVYDAAGRCAITSVNAAPPRVKRGSRVPEQVPQ